MITYNGFSLSIFSSGGLNLTRSTFGSLQFSTEKRHKWVAKTMRSFLTRGAQLPMAVFAFCTIFSLSVVKNKDSENYARQLLCPGWCSRALYCPFRVLLLNFGPAVFPITLHIYEKICTPLNFRKWWGGSEHFKNVCLRILGALLGGFVSVGSTVALRRSGDTVVSL